MLHLLFILLKRQVLGTLQFTNTVDVCITKFVITKTIFVVFIILLYISKITFRSTVLMKCSYKFHSKQDS